MLCVTVPAGGVGRGGASEGAPWLPHMDSGCTPCGAHSLMPGMTASFYGALVLARQVLSEALAVYPFIRASRGLCAVGGVFIPGCR